MVCWNFDFHYVIKKDQFQLRNYVQNSVFIMNVKAYKPKKINWDFSTFIYKKYRNNYSTDMNTRTRDFRL